MKLLLFLRCNSIILLNTNRVPIKLCSYATLFPLPYFLKHKIQSCFASNPYLHWNHKNVCVMNHSTNSYTIYLLLLHYACFLEQKTALTTTTMLIAFSMSSLTKKCFARFYCSPGPFIITVLFAWKTLDANRFKKIVQDSGT